MAEVILRLPRHPRVIASVGRNQRRVPSVGQKPLRETNLPFVMPEDVALRPPAEKRVLTICNLFANQKLSVPQIVSLLDESYGTVIQALISHTLIVDRR